MLITEEYRQLNREMHKRPRGFGADGHRHVDDICNLIVENNLQSLLDYGCGQETLWYGVDNNKWKEPGLKKRLKKYLKKNDFIYCAYDPGVDKRSNFHAPLKQFDIITCTDVLEHIEPECLGDVLCDIFGRLKVIAYFVINFKPAINELPDGRNAHLIQQPKEWWISVLMASAYDFFKPDYFEIENKASHKEFTVCIHNTEFN